MAEYSAVAVAPACLRLLGGWQLLVDGAGVELGHREQRLTALLGLTDLTVRAQVASVLWPDSTDEHALGSLRRAVRQCHTITPGVVVAARQTIGLDPAVRVDVDDLRRAVRLTRLPMTDRAARELLGALRGPELLPGWFDDWVVDERGRLEQLRVEALEEVALHGLRHDDFVLAVEASSAASAIDPLRESAREMCIRGHLGRGDVASAFTELQRYSVVMGEELGVAPPDRIRALLEPLVDAPPRERQTATASARPVAAVEEVVAAAPPPMGLDEWLDGKPAGGARRAAAALVGVAGVALVVALVVALAIALGGPDRPPEATTDPGEGAGLVTPQAEPGSGASQQPTSTVRVRLVESAAGSAAFAVRATPVPAEVRLVVRGRAGLRVVRHVVVRGAGGRQVVVDGLDAGTYRWSATSADAGHVGGEVSVTPPPVPAEVRDDGPSDATATTVPVVETPSQAPTPIPTPEPTRTPTPTPTASPTSRPSPSSSPTGTPQDPGTVAPTPVG